MKPQRFTLRKEYFGGLVHDAKTMAIELLRPDDYEFLAAITKGSKTSIISKLRIDEFLQKGIINCNKKGEY